MKNNGRTLLATACCLMFFLSAGCAALSSLTATGAPLEERVKSYMQAQIDGKWDRAYLFFDTSSREKMPRERYVNRPGKLSYKGFEIEEITVLPPGDQATVKVRMDISFMGYDFKRAPRTQNWVKERGDWFVKFAPESQRTPFSGQEKQK